MGPRAELEQLYRRHRQQFFTVAVAVTGCPQRAEDAVQEAFCRLIRLESRPRELKLYAFRAVRNAALDQSRRRRPHLVESDSVLFETPDSTGEQLERQEFQLEVERALVALDPRERETIVQHVYGGLTFREIALLLDAPGGTVASWYYGGLKKLRARLERFAWKS